MRKIQLAILMVIASVTILQPANALQSVQEDSTETTITLEETATFWVEVKPSASIKWYCDGVLIKSEYSSHSNYTFIPNALGTYYIKLSLDGFTNPMGPRKVTVIAEPIPSASPTANPTPTPIPEFPIAILLIVVLAVVSLLLIFGKRKTG